MVGERNLDKLLQLMAPRVHPETFVFCCFRDFRLPQSLEPISTFAEAEGLTAIVPKKQAEALGIGFQFESAMVTLSVHSSLETIGFLARISVAVAAKGIPCNVVSGYFHDHLFVPPAKVAETLTALAGLVDSSVASDERLDGTT